MQTYEKMELLFGRTSEGYASLTKNNVTNTAKLWRR